MAYQQLGKIDQAAAEYQKSIQMFGSVTFTTAGLGHLYGRAGNTAQARSLFEELLARSKHVYVPAYDLALVCVGLDWKDQAFEWLARAHEERSGWLAYINVEPRLDALRTDVRFTELLRRVRFGC